uniref:Uncharacterized protein n=1 Tax=Oryza rufipogon TaxID=4529 RepID=A0A0E0QEG1_ORYRU
MTLIIIESNGSRSSRTLSPPHELLTRVPQIPNHAANENPVTVLLFILAAAHRLRRFLLLRRRRRRRAVSPPLRAGRPAPRPCARRRRDQEAEPPARRSPRPTAPSPVDAATSPDPCSLPVPNPDESSIAPPPASTTPPDHPPSPQSRQLLPSCESPIAQCGDRTVAPPPASTAPPSHLSSSPIPAVSVTPPSSRHRLLALRYPSRLLAPTPLARIIPVQPATPTAPLATTTTLR